MPVSTTAQIEQSRMLLRISAPSRETGAKMPIGASRDARTANSISDPPMTIASSARMNTPRVGSVANAWTELRMPERTRNVPERLSENVPIASSTVHVFSDSRFSTTRAECSSAVPVSHGSRLAFSTGSQNQYPPQPSS